MNNDKVSIGVRIVYPVIKIDEESDTNGTEGNTTSEVVGSVQDERSNQKNSV